MPRCLPLTVCLVLSSVATAAERPNVLFIAVDDLNHWVGHLHRNEQTRTPHIDRLAKMGVTFTKANCAAPVCNPSRCALMSGLRPSTSGVYDNGQDWKLAIPQEQTLTTQFLNAGYNVYGAGKIYHSDDHRDGEWTEYSTEGRNLKTERHPDSPDDGVGGIKFSKLAGGDDVLHDYHTVSYGLKQLAAEHEKPFFLAIGFHKPHMPFSVPKKYFDQFPLESIELPPTKAGDLDDVPPAGIAMAKPNGDHAAIVASGRWKEAVQAYLATISYMDGQLGRLLDGLEKSPHRDNTIVVFWTDHGWHLGEKEHWRKFALWEEAARTVFIWKVPGVTQPDQRCDKPVDYMSIYPTLCDLCGIERPDHVEGLSIRPLLQNPAAEWKTPALTTYHRNNHSFRSEQWRYIRYADGSEELYNHANDPYEWSNVAQDPNYSAVKAELQQFIPKVNAEERPRTPEGGQPKGQGNKKKRKQAAAAATN
jgi:arylsulfatase A-like enzyme